jgi:hypothetical protein
MTTEHKHYDGIFRATRPSCVIKVKIPISMSHTRFHPDRIAGRDCDHRSSDLSAVAGSPAGSRSRTSNAVQEQPSPGGVGHA